MIKEESIDTKLLFLLGARPKGSKAKVSFPLAVSLMKGVLADGDGRSDRDISEGCFLGLVRWDSSGQA